MRPGGVAPGAGTQAAAARPASAAPAGSPAPAASAAPATAAPGVAAPKPATPGAPAAAPTGDRRPINPFLANDPNQKAKRLARALVSDMLAYHPGKRDEGLANGTLKQIFREEIKKSYEEYVEQIGREFAESTTHFQEALNELLAGGKKMF